MNLSPDEVRSRLEKGNKKYVASLFSTLDTSEELREYLNENGQSPYAVVIACSDSRVNPEAAFSAGLGELFTIRSAGQALLEGEISSVAYAVDHLHVGYILVLGHTRCGAVDSVLKCAKDPNLAKLLGFVKEGVAGENDPRKAEINNVNFGVRLLKERFPGTTVEGAIYDIRSGLVNWLN
ncbi:MAG: carbonic anhydrase [Bacilli bacterium]|nr:carbonic anhydrase [Bacilli bacterium]